MRSALRAIVLAFALAGATSPEARAVLPHTSFAKLPTGNGYGFSVWDAAAGKLVAFTEHPYAQPAPGVQTRNFAYDAYFGVRAAGGASWLSERPVEAVEYAAQTQVVRATQSFGPLA